MRGPARAVEILTLSPFNAPRYGALTFGAHRRRIESFDQVSSVAGRCAAVDGEPIGLALATVEPHGHAVLLSVFVSRPWRGHGIGTELLRRLEQDLAARGQRTITACYDGESDGAPALVALLRACGWPSEGDHAHFFTMDGTILSSPWLSGPSLPGEFEIAPWSTVTPTELAALVEGQRTAPWIPPALMPTRFVHDLEPLNSLVLRRRSAIAGWVLTQPLAPMTIHYANLFVQPAINRVGRTLVSLALLAEAIRREVHALGVRSRGRFEVECDNLTFLKFIDRHLSTYVLEHVEKQRRCKQLQPPKP